MRHGLQLVVGHFTIGPWDPDGRVVWIGGSSSFSPDHTFEQFREKRNRNSESLEDLGRIG